MSSEHALLSRLIDDYILWFVTWHRLTQRWMAAGAEDRVALLKETEPPASFSVWRENAFAELTADQPVIEKCANLHDQLHTLLKLIGLKTPPHQPISPADDDAVIAKYRELMQGLRRCEQAFAAAASELDPLTGLRSRTTLHQDIDRENRRFVRTGRSFCIALMDIDHFKKVNDIHGHEAGDRVLAMVADHVSRNIRAHDEAFRFGGEEFLICIKEADRAVGLQVLERLRMSLVNHPIILAGGATLAITASFGLVVSSGLMTTTELLRRADAALYRAKHEGRNRIVTAEPDLVIEAKT